MTRCKSTLTMLGALVGLLAACDSSTDSGATGAGGAASSATGTGDAATSSAAATGTGGGATSSAASSGGSGGTTTSTATTGASSTSSSSAGAVCEGTGAFCTGVFHNLFASMLSKSDGEVKAKVDAAFAQLFHGDATQTVYYPVAPDEAYILDVGNGDVRTEGMSYGMMIAVQLDKHEEFDRLWRWAANHMQFKSGNFAGYFSWQCSPAGAQIGSTPASDGEEYFATALLLASGRWGNGTGLLDYKAQAQAILSTMLHKEDGGVIGSVTNLFNKNHQVVFVPYGGSASFTDPSYHLPAFYELWAAWGAKDNDFWKTAATTSREFFKTALHGTTGLAPDYANFDGTPNTGGSDHADFRYDAWRVASNIAVDYSWFGADPAEVVELDKLLDFFASQGIASYGNLFTIAGTKLSSSHSPGLVAMNAVAGLAATPAKAKPFIQALWDLGIPSGMYRYYDGMLYMLGLLHVSGNFKIYTPQ